MFKLVEDFVRNDMIENDASHDFEHVRRVHAIAQKLALQEISYGNEVDLTVVEMGALLHDVGDYKYSGNLEGGIEKIKNFLQSLNNQLKKEQIKSILYIVQNIGFKNSLNLETESNHKTNIITGPTGLSGQTFTFTEFNIVRDADRLDAMGALGIGRCLIYAGAKKSPFFIIDEFPRENLTYEDYVGKKNVPAINHFFEKLFLLYNGLVTDSAVMMGQERHNRMLRWVSDIFKEWEETHPSDHEAIEEWRKLLDKFEYH